MASAQRTLKAEFPAAGGFVRVALAHRDDGRISLEGEFERGETIVTQDIIDPLDLELQGKNFGRYLMTFIGDDDQQKRSAAKYLGAITKQFKELARTESAAEADKFAAPQTPRG